MAQSDWIERHLIKAAQLLPAQGPITAFVFLNSLQALEDLPFEEGLQVGRELFGCETYLAEDRYREKMARGRIKPEDLAETLRTDLGERWKAPIGPTGTAFDLRMAMLSHPVRLAPAAELDWFVAETDALSQYRSEVTPEAAERATEQTRVWAMRDVRREAGNPWSRVLTDLEDRDIDQWAKSRWTTFALQSLWEVCRHGVQALPIPQSPLTAIRHRDFVLSATGQDCDPLIHQILIPYSAGFVDQGLATWQLPNREAGFWDTFVQLYGTTSPVECWLRDLPSEIQKLRSLTPVEIIADSLKQLGISETEAPEYLTRELLALRGWAGMIWQAEDRGDRVGRPMPKGTLLQYMAVRLVLLRVALGSIVRGELPEISSLAELRETLRKRIPAVPTTTREERAFEVFQLAQLQGWTAPTLSTLPAEGWATLVEEIESFDAMHRRRLFHLAFERRFRVQALDAIAIHTHGKRASMSPPRSSSRCTASTPARSRSGGTSKRSALQPRRLERLASSASRCTTRASPTPTIRLSAPSSCGPRTT